MQHDLEVDSVSKCYGTHVAVDRLSLAVDHGSFFSILGPSGCGKTTLLRLIAGFLAPDSGDIRIGGRSMRGIAPNRRPVNMVFQQLALFPMMSVGDNVGYGLARRGVSRAETDRRVSAMLERVGLPGAQQRRIDQLSGGQKQRVAIARAVMCDPAILILDDALSSVDTHTAAQILAGLRTVMRGRTSIIIAQRIATVRDADEIIVLHDGAVAERGTHSALLGAAGRYAAMYRRELLEDELSD
jgi:spermidine/putrescine transport system ATP-binding protein